jgi:hypothetical protein
VSTNYQSHAPIGVAKTQDKPRTAPTRPPDSTARGSAPSNVDWKPLLVILGALVAAWGIYLQRRSRLPWVKLKVRPVLRSLFDGNRGSDPAVMRYIPGIVVSGVNQGDRTAILRRLRYKPIFLGRRVSVVSRIACGGSSPTSPPSRNTISPSMGGGMDQPKRDWKVTVGRFVAEDQYDRTFKRRSGFFGGLASEKPSCPALCLRRAWLASFARQTIPRDALP